MPGLESSRYGREDGTLKIELHYEHVKHLRRYEHVLNHLKEERRIMEAQLAYVLRRGQEVQNDMLQYLARTYGVDPFAPMTLDSEAGTLTVPDPPEPPIAKEESQ